MTELGIELEKTRATSATGATACIHAGLRRGTSRFCGATRCHRRNLDTHLWHRVAPVFRMVPHLQAAWLLVVARVAPVAPQKTGQSPTCGKGARP